MFDWKKSTAQMLGRWQPWHDGHTELFKRALSEHGQVCIMIRDVCGADAGMGNTDNPFDYRTVKKNIIAGLEEHGYKCGIEYEVLSVPNIVDISYGRGVGYTFTEHELDKDIQAISATKIRAEMRTKGEL